MTIYEKRRKIIEDMQINRRYGALLCAERKRAGIFRGELAQRLHLSPVDILRWEIGAESPKACMLYSLIRHLGPEALQNAAGIHLNIQVEFNERLYGNFFAGQISPELA